MTSRRRLSTAGGLLAGLLLSACGTSPEPEPRTWNVLFVLLDTLRADHLGIHGYERDTSPHLDAFAAANVWFTQNRSQAACTWPSANSILTSRWPQEFWGPKWGMMGIPDDIPTLAEILTDNGYASVAVSASPIVRKTPSWANKEGGFDDGFARFHEGCAPAEAHGFCLNEQAFTHLGLLRRPFFLYLHYMETHGPYRPPKSWPRRFASQVPATRPWARNGDVGPLSRMLYKDGPDAGATPADIDHMMALYDDELAYFDHLFGELLAELRRRELYDDTLIVFLSDHGESFLEHEDFTHCRSVWEPEIHVPLMLRVPGVEGPVRIDRPVGNIDVLPTLLDYLGIDASPYDFEGRSLRPLIEGRAGAAEPPEPVYSLMNRWRSATDGRYKLVEHLTGRMPTSVYDLDADPGETRNVLDSERRAYRRLSEGLESWLETVEPNARSQRSIERSDEALQRLRAVGYIH